MASLGGGDGHVEGGVGVGGGQLGGHNGQFHVAHFAPPSEKKRKNCPGEAYPPVDRKKTLTSRERIPYIAKSTIGIDSKANSREFPEY